MNYPEDNTNSSSNSEKGVKMMSTIKSKKSTLPVDKINDTQPREDTNASRHTANLASADAIGGENPVNLTLLLTEIRNPSQDVQLRDLKGEKVKTNSLDEVGARIRENEKKL